MNTSHKPLTAQDLLAAGPLRRLGRRVFVLDQIDSTNAFLLERAVEAGDGALAAAEFQTAGRGRLGRRWQAPRGSAVLLSVLLHEPVDSVMTSRATLLAAVAACEAIEAATSVAPRVRWPNDLVVGGRKLGGVLAESAPLATASGASSPGMRAVETGTRAVVVGVGLNCLQQRGHFSRELADLATSLELESVHAVSRAAVAAALVARMDDWLDGAARADGGERLLAAWRARCSDFGVRVRLEHDRRVFTGTAVEIDDAGALVVQLDTGGRRAFAAETTTRMWQS